MAVGCAGFSVPRVRPGCTHRRPRCPRPAGRDRGHLGANESRIGVPGAHSGQTRATSGVILPSASACSQVAPPSTNGPGTSLVPSTRAWAAPLFRSAGSGRGLFRVGVVCGAVPACGRPAVVVAAPHKRNRLGGGSTRHRHRPHGHRQIPFQRQLLTQQGMSSTTTLPGFRPLLFPAPLGPARVLEPRGRGPRVPGGQRELRLPRIDTVVGGRRRQRTDHHQPLNLAERGRSRLVRPLLCRDLSSTGMSGRSLLRPPSCWLQRYWEHRPLPPPSTTPPRSPVPTTSPVPTSRPVPLLPCARRP